MRLLVINFEMNRLSRAMPWSQQVVDLLARSCERVVVMTERIGEYSPPENVQLELIPVKPLGIPRKLGSSWIVNYQAYRLARKHRVHACFIHMAMPWAYRLAPCFRLLNLPVVMWYAHGTVTRELEWAHRAATRVLTSTPEGFRLPSRKVRIIGQGVDDRLFDIQDRAPSPNDLITVSRISERKRIELLIATMREIRDRGEAPPLRLRIIGTTLNDADQDYEASLREQVWAQGLEDVVRFEGFVPHRHIPAYYGRAFAHINVSRTGSMDKTVVESLAAGCPVLTSNEAFHGILVDYPRFIIHDDHPRAIADQVLELHRTRNSLDPSTLRALVAGRHDVESYAARVLRNLEEVRNRNGKATEKAEGST